MTRRGKLLRAAAGVALVAFSLPYFVWRPTRLNHDGYEQVQNGMTQYEVESLMGGPPGLYYPADPDAGSGKSLEGYFVPRGVVEVHWCDDKRCYEVLFDDNGRVAGKHKRCMWYSGAYLSRYTAMLWSSGKPTPLTPRRYTASPPDHWRAKAPVDATKP